MPEYGHKEGLLELTYRSFVYVRGYTQEFGAADVALCVTAFLETSDSAKESFWKAYEAVDVQNGEWKAFLDGINLAKKVTKAIVRQGSGALMKNIIKNKGKHLNVCHFEQSADSQLLAHPSPIERVSSLLLPHNTVFVYICMCKYVMVFLLLLFFFLSKKNADVEAARAFRPRWNTRGRRRGEAPAGCPGLWRKQVASVRVPWASHNGGYGKV